MNDQSFGYFLVPSKMRSSHPFRVADVRKTPLDELSALANMETDFASRRS